MRLKAWKVTTGSRSDRDRRGRHRHRPDPPRSGGQHLVEPGRRLRNVAAGTHGYNVVSKTCVPEDEDELYKGHGTHVARDHGRRRQQRTGRRRDQLADDDPPGQVDARSGLGRNERADRSDRSSRSPPSRKASTSASSTTRTPSSGPRDPKRSKTRSKSLGRKQHPVRDLGRQHRQQQRRSSADGNATPAATTSRPRSASRPATTKTNCRAGPTTGRTPSSSRRPA